MLALLAISIMCGHEVGCSMKIFFITGTSGSGKTTLTQYLKTKLSKTHFEVYDFDENGVPTDADVAWRQRTTDYWLKKSQENSKQNKSTIICGVSVPSEILASAEKVNQQICFGFIKITDEIIQRRLQARGWNDQLIRNNINWAHYLEKQVQQQVCYLIVDNSFNITPEQMADEFIKWINFVESN